MTGFGPLFHHFLSEKTDDYDQESGVFETGLTMTKQSFSIDGFQK